MKHSITQVISEKILTSAEKRMGTGEGEKRCMLSCGRKQHILRYAKLCVAAGKTYGVC